MLEGRSGHSTDSVWLNWSVSSENLRNRWSQRQWDGYLLHGQGYQRLLCLGKCLTLAPCDCGHKSIFICKRAEEVSQVITE
ncbi:hypothetical protein FKM82_020379 [Ascaphus truei]